MNIEGKGAIITGAGRGLGAALAEKLASKGAKVVLVARTKSDLDAVVARIVASGGTAHALAYDVADKDAVHAIAHVAAELAGPIDILVNNASSLGPVPLPYLLDTACEDLEDVFRTNVVGPFRLTKAVIGSMVVRGTGVVVNISSDAAVEPYPKWGAYAASKAALDHLTRIFAAETEGTGVRFLAIDPGEMDTKMHADAIPDADRSTLADPKDVAAKIVARIESSEKSAVRVAA
jgi:NAD(P)-dependent dehydrogenase (short-subunit alcohol dehydrogenase family)